MGQQMGQPKTLTTGTTNGTIKCGQPKTLVKWDIQRDNQVRMTEDIQWDIHWDNQVRATEDIQWDNQTGHFGYCFIFL